VGNLSIRNRQVLGKNIKKMLSSGMVIECIANRFNMVRDKMLLIYIAIFIALGITLYLKIKMM